MPASLLLNANRVVSTGALLAPAWHGKDPAGAENVLEAQVKRLRAKLDSWDPGGRGRRRLATRGRGYLLHVDEGELDVDRFTALRARGRALLGEDPRAARPAARAGPAAGSVSSDRWRAAHRRTEKPVRGSGSGPAHRAGRRCRRRGRRPVRAARPSRWWRPRMTMS
ncbi:helix-turn-helix domain-containing protein [Actinokineospora sp. PR83]|uniref:AfsR/SARP family transcriptional regulator n=1 Tax=Actinokineospora sp. PR83 TaxID=2884908 RepID=UPI0027DF02D4|nr:helix-turn-helix domain-containing protein [Actinokineospora sp. PR83]MCG8917158.1 helix-turn-helix domain-containing protein [Actinokineospora sp. PR83]